MCLVQTIHNGQRTFRIKYVIKDSYGVQYYTVLCNETGEMHDFTEKQVKENVYKYLQNCKIADGKIITDAQELYVGTDIKTASGRTITGWNDLETWCIKNKKPGILRAFIAGDNDIEPQKVACRSGKYYKFKCTAKLPDGTICNTTRRQILKGVTSSKSEDFKCLACLAREGRAVTLVRGINDLETWCKQNNRTDILKAWDYSQQIKPSDVQARTYDNKVKIKCGKCGKVMTTTPIQLTKYPTSTVCEACRATGTQIPQLVFDKVLRNRFKSVQYRYKLGVSHFELDEYIPELNLGIEYNGLWHDTYDGEYRDYTKRNICNQLGIKVLYITEVAQRISPRLINDNNIEIWRYSTRSIEPYQYVLSVLETKFNIAMKPITEDELKSALESAYGVIKRDSVPNNITITHPKEASTWDYEKNGNLKPEMFTAGQPQKAFWKCTDCRIPHSYEKDIRHRCNRGQGCPVVAGQLVMKGVNDLGTTAPGLLKFWDYEKNNKLGLKPEYLTVGQGKLVFWKCPHCGYGRRETVRIFQNLKKCKACKAKI